MPHTLLLADDSVTIQRVIELTFADEDVRVVAVSDGDEAIAILNKTPPDIVLADVGMPGRNGYEVAEHMKNTPRLAHIPIMLLTGAFEPIDQAKAAAAGCDGVLAKPFEPQLVIGKVKELLSKPKKVGASSSVPPGRAAAPAKPVVEPKMGPAVPAASKNAPAEGPSKATPSDGKDYFDRLDQAFANMSTQTEPAKQGAASSPVDDSIDWFAGHPPADGPASVGSTLLAMPDRWDGPSNAPPPDLPLSYASPPPVSRSIDSGQSKSFDAAAAKPADVAQGKPFDAPLAKPFDAPPAKPVGAGQGRPFDAVQSRPFDAAQGRPAPPPVPPPMLPPLADAFAALLAAEQAAPSPSAAPIWPGMPAPAVAPITEDLVEEVTRRVLERLSDRVMREAVAEKVSSVAERLVRDEIERIKKTIK